MPRSTSPARRRRTAEEARREILDVAEARFLAEGPGALRLQEIAAEVGVSHPTILHHFGSREGLVRAVAARSLEALQTDLVATLDERDVARIDLAALIKRVFSTLGEQNQARMLAWLALSTEGRAMASEAGPFLRVLSMIVHARRTRDWKGPGPVPSFEDSRFVVMLATTALIGDALIGQAVRASGGFGDDPDSARRFHDWFADLLVGHLSGE
ncbi:MAG: TetR/AcrR family transcriptional regulator [Deltaproteobacteria bacterium]|nr:TetR/AcrR family transcriptional regulator [Deltaproteobacteria bacterium]